MKWNDLFLLLCAFVLAGCVDDVERSNPLDPKSDGFDNTGRLSGRVLTFYSPAAPISNAEIKLEPGPFVAISNNSGTFQLLSLEPGQYKISAEKSGYATYTDSVEISAQQSSNIDFNLDGLPVVSSFTVKTGRISRWFPTDDLLTLDISTEITDPDGLNDINTVEWLIPRLGIRESLTTISPGLFVKRYLENNLPGGNLFDLMGHELQLIAADNAGYSSEPATQQIVRIIDAVPVAVSPVGLQRLNESRPELTWQKTIVPFQFTYRLDLFRDDSGITNTIESQPGIPGEQTTTRVTSILTTGRYFWTISILDEFGNTSRSKEAAFEVD